MGKRFFKKIFLFLILFYFLAIFQNSFLPHFAIANVGPNFVLIAVLLFCFFEKKENFLKSASGFLAGFFWDIFSALPFGTLTLALGFSVLISQKVLANFKKINLLSTILIFIIAIFIFQFLSPVFSFLFKLPSQGFTPLRFPFNYFLLINLCYTTLLGLLFFLLFKNLPVTS